MVMERLATNSHDYHGGRCYGDLLHVVWKATCLLILLTTSIPTVAAASTNLTSYLPTSNMNDSLFSYSSDVGYFRSLQIRSSLTSLLSCNNNSILEALSSQERLYGRSAGVFSENTVWFQLYFVISADEICTRNNASTPSYYLSLLAYNFNNAPHDLNRAKVVWTANVGNPVGENACLYFSPSDSNLRLVDYDRNGLDNVVWQTNTPGHSNAALTITYEGNMVLYTNAILPNDTTIQQHILWQSYDHPTDTLMVLQALVSGMNLTTSTTESGNSTKTARFTLLLEQDGALALYAKTQYKSFNSMYGYRYWSLPLNAAQESNGPYNHAAAAAAAATAAAALCWYPEHPSSLHFDIVQTTSNGSDGISKYNQISPQACSRRASESQIVPITIPNITYATFLRLESDGDLHAYTVNVTRFENSTTGWRDFPSVIAGSSDNPCKLPLFCGFYGVCDRQIGNCTQNCGGSNELELQDSNNNAKLGCKFKASNGKWEPDPDFCGDGSTNYKKPNASIIAGATYFSNAFLPPHYTGIDANVCWESHCKDNCTCTAAFWESKANGSVSCFLIHGPVATIILNASATKEEFIGYLKFMEDPDTSSPTTPLTKPIEIGVAVGVFLLVMAVVVCGVYVQRRRRLQARRLEDYEIEKELLGDSLLGSKPLRFTWKEMHEYTCGFSDPLGGGGFGNVFRGAMEDGTPIAVKQLIDGSEQGNKEFIAEVSILGRTHHLQLVRLVGFCLEGATHKLLVYEYMEKGSLDAWIFSKTPKPTPESEEIRAEKQRPILSWERRFAIAVGTAKGLAYLHEECEDRIIHMDLKPQNILLGADFFPKISDFGMSRRVVRDQQSAVVTMMRGTPGYLAPEWLTEGAITEKCDVYSYGIVLLEIVRGRRVRDWSALRKRLEMRPNRGEGVMELVDERLMNYGMGGVKIYDEEQALRMVEVAMLCVQSNPRRRPSMSSVVEMLEGKVGVIPHAPIDDYEQMGLFPSEKIMRRRRDGHEELELDGESWKSGGNSTMTSKSRKSIFGSKTSYKYMEISRFEEEYMDAL